MNDWDTSVGESLRTERKRLNGMSQGRLAEKMHDRGFPWTQTTVSTVEAGARSLKVPEALMLSRILDISIDQLLAGPQSTIDRALGDLRDRGALFMAAAIDLHRAQRRLEALSSKLGMPIHEMLRTKEDIEFGQMDIEHLVAAEVPPSDATPEAGRSVEIARPPRRRQR